MWARLLAFCSRLGFAWARQRLDDEARRELENHLDLLTNRYIHDGMTAADARVAAQRQLGNAAIVREDIYRMNGIQWADGLAQDGRYALRQMRRAPIFAAVVIATLAIGIGGTTAVFSVVHAVLLAPLPYAEPERLVRLYQQQPGDPSSRYYLTGPYVTALRDHTTSFDAVAASNTYSETGLDLVKDGHVQRIRILQVTSGYFRTLEAGPLSGPGFELRDETETDRVVLSEALWRSRFGGDLSVIGSTVLLSGKPYEVAGVAPAGLEDPVAGEIDAWVPYNLSRNTGSENYSLTALGRLRKGITPEQAQAELATLSGTLKERHPGVSRSALAIVPLQADMVAASRGPLQLALIAVALVLLVACVNVANLALVRATGRIQEFAIRSALGSGRAKLVRQLLVENLILAGVGGVTGVVLAMLGVKMLRHLGRDAIPRLDAVGFDGAVLGFALVVTVATSLTFGIAPALRLARVPPSQALRQQSRSASGTRNQGRLRSALAAAQLALALTLLAGAGVLLASLYRLQHVSLGFRVDKALTFEVHLPTTRYGVERRAAFHEDLARRIQSIPGVVAAGGTSRLPGTGSFHPWPTRIETGPLAGENLSRSDGIVMQQRTVSGEIFRALDVPLLAGRTFDDRDTSSAPKVAVVSVGFARRAFPGLPLDAAIGQRIAVLGNRRQIVGVVGDVTTDIYGARSLAVYHAHRQFADNRNWALTQVVATELPPNQIVPAVRAAVAAIDPELVVHRPAALAEVVGRGLARERFAMVLMGAFAVVALLLASLGLYGVLAYAVRQRTQEIGIRMALGATAAQVRGVVLRQAAVVLGAGLIAGTAGALLIGRWLSSLVFETSPSDPRILIATALLLTLTGLIAAWLPARRAARVEPRIAIQES